MSIFRRHALTFSFLALCILFILLPGIDLWMSRLFYEPGTGFFLRDAIVPRIIRDAVSLSEDVSLWGLSSLFLLTWVGGRSRFARHRAHIGYLLAVLLLGPGFLVNVVLKEHMGRARPGDIMEFGGSAVFTPALIPSDQCDSNCSFVSGHAAMGFFPLAIAFAFPRRHRFWLLLGVASGAISGWARIVQGKHFFSDVVFAFFAVYATAVLICYFFRRMGWLPAPASDTALNMPTTTRQPAAPAVVTPTKTENGKDLRPIAD